MECVKAEFLRGPHDGETLELPRCSDCGKPYPKVARHSERGVVSIYQRLIQPSELTGNLVYCHVGDETLERFEKRPREDGCGFLNGGEGDTYKNHTNIANKLGTTNTYSEFDDNQDPKTDATDAMEKAKKDFFFRQVRAAAADNLGKYPPELPVGWLHFHLAHKALEQKDKAAWDPRKECPICKPVYDASPDGMPPR